jgi:hypothetical protein
MLIFYIKVRKEKEMKKILVIVCGAFISLAPQFECAADDAGNALKVIDEFCSSASPELKPALTYTTFAKVKDDKLKYNGARAETLTKRIVKEKNENVKTDKMNRDVLKAFGDDDLSLTILELGKFADLGAADIKKSASLAGDLADSAAKLRDDAKAGNDDRLLGSALYEVADAYRIVSKNFASSLSDISSSISSLAGAKKIESKKLDDLKAKITNLVGSILVQRTAIVGSARIILENGLRLKSGQKKLYQLAKDVLNANGKDGSDKALVKDGKPGVLVRFVSIAAYINAIENSNANGKVVEALRDILKGNPSFINDVLCIASIFYATLAYTLDTKQYKGEDNEELLKSLTSDTSSSEAKAEEPSHEESSHDESTSEESTSED